MNLSDIDLNKLAKELRLTEKQKLFAEYFVFVTGLEAVPAVELAGYKLVNDDYSFKDEQVKEMFRMKEAYKTSRSLLNNHKILRYISALREELNNQLIVDKLWVIKKLKDLALTGCESTQLKATELLGKTLELFTDKSKVYEGVDDPAKIARESFEKRINNNVVNFKERAQNE